MAEIVGFIGTAVAVIELLGSVLSLIAKYKETDAQLQSHAEVFASLQGTCQRIAQTRKFDTEDIRKYLKLIDEILRKHIQKMETSTKLGRFFISSAVKNAVNDLEQHKSSLMLAIMIEEKNDTPQDQEVMHSDMVGHVRAAESIRNNDQTTTVYCGFVAGHNIHQVNGILSSDLNDYKQFPGKLVYYNNIKIGAGIQYNFAPGGTFVGGKCVAGKLGEQVQLNGYHNFGGPGSLLQPPAESSSMTSLYNGAEPPEEENGGTG